MEAKPKALVRIHRDYVNAGAEVIVANTFRTDRRTLAKVGRRDDARPLTLRSVELAREGVRKARAKHAVFVAGSVAPLEDCYRPDLVPDTETLRAEHGLRIGDLAHAGVDLAWIETMNTTREAMAVLGAARAANLAAVVSFVLGDEPTLLSGEPLRAAVQTVEAAGPLAILVNCCAPQVATEALPILREATALPVGVYANGVGHKTIEGTWSPTGGTRDRAYARFANVWRDLGASVIGGCCGTTPKTIRRLRRVLR